MATALLLFSASANAVELGNIDVSSHLGQPFHAEVPLILDSGEELSSLYIELAAPADYRTLNVHRDEAVNMIRADIVKDLNGSHVELSSRQPIDAPLLSLVLKIRYGRATHFKQYPLALKLPSAIRPARAAAPAAAVAAGPQTDEMVPAEAMAAASEGASTQISTQSAAEETTTVITTSRVQFRPFDGWARTSRYGPIVRGDILYIISDRLRIDERYTLKQVMVALFEKNSDKFSEDNLNLPVEGAFLDVPSAAEVERHSYEEALAIIEDHNQRWKVLQQQPRYAAIAAAQKNRYSKR